MGGMGMEMEFKDGDDGALNRMSRYPLDVVALTAMCAFFKAKYPAITGFTSPYHAQSRLLAEIIDCRSHDDYQVGEAKSVVFDQTKTLENGQHDISNDRQAKAILGQSAAPWIRKARRTVNKRHEKLKMEKEEKERLEQKRKNEEKEKQELKEKHGKPCEGDKECMQGVKLADTAMLFTSDHPSSGRLRCVDSKCLFILKDPNNTLEDKGQILENQKCFSDYECHFSQTLQKNIKSHPCISCETGVCEQSTQGFLGVCGNVINGRGGYRRYGKKGNTKN